MSLTRVGHCDQLYTESPYIAEVRNSLSCILLILLPLYGMAYYPRNKVNYILIFSVGVSSAIYHATCLYFWQMADELTIGLTVFYIVWKSGKVDLTYLVFTIPILFIYPLANRYLLFINAFICLFLTIWRGKHVCKFAQLLGYLAVVIWIVDSQRIYCIHDWWHLLMGIVVFIVSTPEINDALA